MKTKFTLIDINNKGKKALSDACDSLFFVFLILNILIIKE